MSQSNWTEQTLTENVLDHLLTTQQTHICFSVISVHSEYIVLFIINGKIYRLHALFNKAMSLIGYVILKLSQYDIFDTIITMKLGFKYEGYSYHWMKVLCDSNDFNSLIRIKGDTLDPLNTVEEYNILCTMISRNKMVAIHLYMGTQIYHMGKWLVDASNLLNAIKSTNTLQQINLCGNVFNTSLPTSFDYALAQLLKKALQENRSVISLHGSDLDGGHNIENDSNFGFIHPDIRECYMKWWHLIKKRNIQVLNNKKLFESVKECRYFNLCKQVLKQCFSSISSLYFNKNGDKCFCKKCHIKRKDELIYSRGKPKKRYALPIGWVRFGLNADGQKCLTNKVWSNWHVAFHGTLKDVIPQIFKGSLVLLKPGDATISGEAVSIRRGHIRKPFKRTNKFTKKTEMFDPNQIYVSPSIKYSGREVYAKKYIISHPEDNNRTLSIQCAFQLRIRPGSYGIGQETVGATRKRILLDGNFSNNELEWYTKKNNDIVLYGLLFRIKKIYTPFSKYKE